MGTPQKRPRLFGKDEVGGSNPPSSSNKYLKSSDFRCFFVANVDFFVWVKMWGSGLTHTVTHTRNKLYPRKWTQWI